MNTTTAPLPSLHTLLYSIGLDPAEHRPSKVYSPLEFSYSPMSLTPNGDAEPRFAFSTPSTPSSAFSRLGIGKSNDNITISPPTPSPSNSTPNYSKTPALQIESFLDTDKRQLLSRRRNSNQSISPVGIQKPVAMKASISDKVVKGTVKKEKTKIILQDLEQTAYNKASSTPLGVLEEDKQTEIKYQTGKWSEEEHEQFLRGLNEFGHQWSLIARYHVKTRERSQIASHAQKYFKKINEA
ncbi:hypothetical protein AKO1_008518 [Acrasis kona]|uniref:Uncharacterized protein n=1 Tax=Acrasis kona TaxID=1008807 RepID=A0AAW2YMW5_9EUKA